MSYRNTDTRRQPQSNRNRFRVVCVIVAALFWSRGLLSAHAALDENCTANLLNRSAQVDTSGGFGVGNIPWEAGYFRVRVICKDVDTTVRGASPFVQLRQFVVTLIETISFDAVDPQSAMGRGA
jgi:hypothetical protein